MLRSSAIVGSAFLFLSMVTFVDACPAQGGVAWNQLSPANSPSARFLHAMAYDAARQLVVVFGGSEGNNAPADTWEWGGVNWTQATPAQSPPARAAHSMVYDAARQRVVLFGGVDSSSGRLQDTWECSSLSPASFTTFGTGCPCSLGILTLEAALFSSPWIGDNFSVELGNLPPGSFPFMALGFTRTSTPIPQLPGCTQLSSAQAAVALTLNGNTATWSQVVPVNPALVGWSLFLQGAALNAGGNNVLGAALSNGGQATIGMR